MAQKTYLREQSTTRPIPALCHSPYSFQLLLFTTSHSPTLYQLFHLQKVTFKQYASIIGSIFFFFRGSDVIEATEGCSFKNNVSLKIAIEKILIHFGSPSVTRSVTTSTRNQAGPETLAETYITAAINRNTITSHSTNIYKLIQT